MCDEGISHQQEGTDEEKTCLLHESVVTSSISRICRLSLSEVLIGVGLRACIHRDECACVFVSVCVCSVFLKKHREKMQ